MKTKDEGLTSNSLDNSRLCSVKFRGNDSRVWFQGLGFMV